LGVERRPKGRSLEEPKPDLGEGASSPFNQLKGLGANGGPGEATTAVGLGAF